MNATDITITINGKAASAPAGINLHDCLLRMEIDPRTVVAEVNGEILKPEDFDGRILNAGDAVELIHFVGGG